MIDIPGSIRKAWGIVTHPSTAKPMSISEAIKFYYSFMVIPGILAIIITYFVSGAFQAAIILVTIVILEVIGIFIDAAIYQFFGKYLFRKFTSGYSNTFTAVTLATAPYLLFVWLVALTTSISYLNLAIALILGIWGLTVLTISLMKLQKVSGAIAVLSWLVPAIIIAIIVLLLLLFTYSLYQSGALTHLNSYYTTTI